MICSTHKNYIIRNKTKLNIIVPISAIVTGSAFYNGDDYYIHDHFIV